MPAIVNKTMDDIQDRMAKLQQNWALKPQVAEQQAERIRKGKRLLNDSGAPERHINTDQFRTEPVFNRWTDTVSSLIKLLGTGFTAALVGFRGRGKTQLAVEIIRHQCFEALKSVSYCKAVEFFMDIRAAFGPQSKITPKSVVAQYRHPELLVIDETQERFDTQTELIYLTLLLDLRYDDRLDTLLISNTIESELEASIGDSVLRRIDETGGIFRCDWPPLHNPES